MIPCAVTDWDNTPRHRMNGYVYEGVTTKKFGCYFRQLVENTRKYYDTDMILFLLGMNGQKVDILNRMKNISMDS